MKIAHIVDVMVEQRFIDAMSHREIISQPIKRNQAFSWPVNPGYGMTLHSNQP